MSQICRLCASVKSFDELVSIKDSNFNIEIKINLLSQVITLSDDEHLPQNACLECIVGLDSCLGYIDRVNKAQESLKHAFYLKIVNNLEKLPLIESEVDANEDIMYLNSSEDEERVIEPEAVDECIEYSVKMENNEIEVSKRLCSKLLNSL